MYEPYIKVGNYVFPLDKIRLESFKIAPDQRQEFDSYVDGNGVLQRPNVVVHTRTKIEFETPPMYVYELRAILNNIWENLTDTLKVECTVTYYDIETNSNKSGNFYLSATREYTFFNKDIVNPVRFAFIEK